jgi:hypothetical protein
MPIDRKCIRVTQNCMQNCIAVNINFKYLHTFGYFHRGMLSNRVRTVGWPRSKSAGPSCRGTEPLSHILCQAYGRIQFPIVVQKRMRMFIELPVELRTKQFCRDDLPL